LALLEADYKVVIVDNLYNSSEEVINRIELICGKRPPFYKVDITDSAALDKVFDEHPDIDNVIHFAALKVSIHPFLVRDLAYLALSRLLASPPRFLWSIIESMLVAVLHF
jgi:nucleoside-diphosphate-sugar epimerase